MCLLAPGSPPPPDAYQSPHRIWAGNSLCPTQEATESPPKNPQEIGIQYFEKYYIQSNESIISRHEKCFRYSLRRLRKCHLLQSGGFFKPKIFLYSPRQPMVALRLDSHYLGEILLLLPPLTKNLATPLSLKEKPAQ